MLVQNQKDLLVANVVYGNTSTAFGWAGRNAEYAQYWRKIIKDYFANLYIMETGATPQILPELIRQYEVLDEKYPDLKEVNAPAEEEPFNFEDTLLPHVKAITQALKKQNKLTGSSFDLAIYNSCTVLNEIDNSSTPVKDSRYIYVDE